MLCIGMARTYAQDCGCTDPRALNYNPEATVNDGSCTYAQTTVTPYYSTNLDERLNGSSGAVFFDGMLFTHNDHNDRSLFQIDTADAHILRQLQFSGIPYHDVEDCDHDSLYVYLGDMGNNVSGNRTDLHFLRILKSSLFSDHPVIDTVWFSYSDQTDFTLQESNTTDFDGEAFIVVGDSIYIFSKQWTTHHTTLYVLPKTAGTHVAQRRGEYDVNGLVTSACYLPDERQVVLCGYSNTLQPFIVLLYDYRGTDFFSGNKRKINFNLPFHQVEAITHRGAWHFYLTNEQISRYGVRVAAKFHKLDLSAYLSPMDPQSLPETPEALDFEVFPNPANHTLYVVGTRFVFGEYEIFNDFGQLMQRGRWQSGMSEVRLPSLPDGVYIIKVTADGQSVAKRFVIE